MIRSVLDNRRFSSWFEFRQFALSVNNAVSDRRWSTASPETYRRLRMIVDQYKIHRNNLQSINSLKGVENWLNANPLPLNNVPLNHLDMDEKIFFRPRNMEFRNMVVDDIDTIFYIGLNDDEEVFGKGWSGQLRVRFPENSKNLTQRLKQSLGAYGIYSLEITYVPDLGDPHYIFYVALLERDFKFKNFNEAEWHQIDPEDDDYFNSLGIDDIEKHELERMFDDDAQYFDMGFDDGFE